jgi:linoleoyl-CoA desaturase
MAVELSEHRAVDHAAVHLSTGATAAAEATTGPAMPEMPTSAELRIAHRQLRRNAVFVAALWSGAYLLLVGPWLPSWSRLVGAVVMVVAIVAMATSVMHDANHGAFGANRRVNRVLGCTLDVLGGSSALWRRSHNVVHHLNPNVVGVDADIEQGPFARLAPGQPWRRWHRFQHVYMWPLYGFVTLKWLLHSDFAALAGGGVGSHRFATGERRRALSKALLGKAFHVSWAFVLPMFVHPWWSVVVFYLAISWVAGLMLATMFQVAHCVDAADFTSPAAPRRGRHWAQHQLRTTVNVRCRARGFRRLATWLMGGLDHQIEHHLAPGLPHTVHPAFSVRVKAFCAEAGYTYREHPSVLAAVRSHGRWLKAMGQRPAPFEMQRLPGE